MQVLKTYRIEVYTVQPQFSQSKPKFTKNGSMTKTCMFEKYWSSC